jgi:hypothetical protein
MSVGDSVETLYAVAFRDLWLCAEQKGRTAFWHYGPAGCCPVRWKIPKEGDRQPTLYGWSGVWVGRGEFHSFGFGFPFSGVMRLLIDCFYSMSHPKFDINQFVESYLPCFDLSYLDQSNLIARIGASSYRCWRSSHIIGGLDSIRSFIVEMKSGFPFPDGASWYVTFTADLLYEVYGDIFAAILRYETYPWRFLVTTWLVVFRRNFLDWGCQNPRQFQFRFISTFCPIISSWSEARLSFFDRDRCRHPRSGIGFGMCNRRRESFHISYSEARRLKCPGEGNCQNYVKIGWCLCHRHFSDLADLRSHSRF